MRPILPADLDLAARVLMTAPIADRRVVMARLIAQADIADRYRKRLRKAHPLFGSGSLMAAALRHDHSAPARQCDDHYCACLADVLCALAAYRRRHESAKSD